MYHLPDVVADLFSLVAILHANFCKSTQGASTAKASRVEGLHFVIVGRWPCCSTIPFLTGRVEYTIPELLFCLFFDEVILLQNSSF